MRGSMPPELVLPLFMRFLREPRVLALPASNSSTLSGPAHILFILFDELRY